MRRLLQHWAGDGQLQWMTGRKAGRGIVKCNAKLCSCIGSTFTSCCLMFQELPELRGWRTKRPIPVSRLTAAYCDIVSTVNVLAFNTHWHLAELDAFSRKWCLKEISAVIFARLQCSIKFLISAHHYYGMTVCQFLSLSLPFSFVCVMPGDSDLFLWWNWF